MRLEVSTDELRKYSIFLAAPMFGGMCHGLYAKSIADLNAMCARYGIELRTYYLFNESLIQRARNYSANEFMRSGCTHMMFIDADIGFNPNDVLSLLAIQTTYPDEYDVVGAPYPKKAISWEKTVDAVRKGLVDDNPFDLINYSADFVFNPAEGQNTFDISKPLAVSEMGTGFMMIPRQVFEKFDAAYPELRYLPDHTRTENFDGTQEITAYFHCDFDENRRLLSEDYFFCRKVREIGMNVHLCPWMELQHVGSHIYRGSMSHLARLGATPTADEKSNPKFYKK
jgi:hypothetical protein